MTSTPIGAGTPSPVTPLFKTQTRALLPQTNGIPINFIVDNEHYCCVM